MGLCLVPWAQPLLWGAMAQLLLIAWGWSPAAHAVGFCLQTEFASSSMLTSPPSCMLIAPPSTVLLHLTQIAATFLTCARQQPFLCHGWRAAWPPLVAQAQRLHF